LSGPFIAWLEHPQTLTAAAVPVVLLFTRRLSRGPTAPDLIGLVVSTYLVMSGGHPETQVMAALLGAAVLIRAAPSARAAVTPVAGALIGVALAAPLLIPFVEYFVASQARLGMDRRPFVLPLRDLQRFLFPRLPDTNLIEAASTVSLTVLALAAAGLLRWRRDRRVPFWAAIAAIIAVVTYRNPLSLALAHHTPVYWTRALLFLPLPLAYLASGALDALVQNTRARAGRTLARIVEIVAVLLVSGELLLAAQGVHGSARPSDLEKTTPLLDTLRADRSIFRVLPLHTFLPPDSASLYGLDDVRGYDALSPRRWRYQLEAIGRVSRAPTQLEVLEPWDLVAGGAALDDWNVKYLLLHPQFAFGAEELNAKKGLDLEQVYSGPDGRILRNRRVRPRARLSGEGRVDIDQSLPRLWSLRVEANVASVLTLANPMFPGWTARIDGRRVPVLGDAGEAMRLSLPPGVHRVEFLYVPASFRAGCWAALGAILALVILARRLPRERSA
ncbi:MAG: hypothetical protein ABI968_12570, partial [Acidobacteriota bacterium]